jgi:heterodisulfide reductase subunit A
VKEVLVIGGGPAGLTAAKTLVDSGARVVLVEKNESLGGMARELTCKGLVECRNCGVCYVTDTAREVLRASSAEVLLRSEVASISRDGGGYVVKIKCQPRYVTDDCIGCGKCTEVCPVDGKAVLPPTGSGEPRAYWIDRARCQHFRKAKCDKCFSVCPANAIDYEDRARSLTRKVSAVVYATGISAVEACDLPRLGCGVLNDVISSVDAERILNEKGRLLRPSDGAPPKKVAVMQCVGSRSVKAGVEYCSKFCCKYATKIAQKQVRLIRSMPATVTLGTEGKVVVRSSGDSDLEVKDEEYDLVILSVGMRPEGTETDLAKSLGVVTDQMGFAVGSPELESAGIYVCGAASQPLDIEETAVRAMAAASRIRQVREVPR